MTNNDLFLQTLDSFKSAILHHSSSFEWPKDNSMVGVAVNTEPKPGSASKILYVWQKKRILYTFFYDEKPPYTNKFDMTDWTLAVRLRDFNYEVPATPPTGLVFDEDYCKEVIGGFLDNRKKCVPFSAEEELRMETYNAKLKTKPGSTDAFFRHDWAYIEHYHLLNNEGKWKFINLFWKMYDLMWKTPHTPLKVRELSESDRELVASLNAKMKEEHEKQQKALQAVGGSPSQRYVQEMRGGCAMQFDMNKLGVDKTSLRSLEIGQSIRNLDA